MAWKEGLVYRTRLDRGLDGEGERAAGTGVEGAERDGMETMTLVVLVFFPADVHFNQLSISLCASIPVANVLKPVSIFSSISMYFISLVSCPSGG